ncbi:response regulator [Draconibacterium orientale]|uniref:response regulator n=1 Tax=Draconibacterium orientale TaxID=1168034 RepID=UPI002A0A20EA|nr:response regulator [Draconibacterium orientale]
MEKSFVVELIQNVAFLLVFTFFYGKQWIENIRSERILPKVLIGVVVGVIGMFFMYNRWMYQPGHSLDLRTVLLSISGLYLGAIPTIVAMLLMGIYRVIIGGDLMILGLLLIASSGLLGIGWRYFLHKKNKPFSLSSLYILGLVTHAVMLLWLVLLPKEDFLIFLQRLVVPVMVIYPLITLILGLLMNRQRVNWENEKAKDRFIESEQRFVRIMQNINMFFFSLDLKGNFVSCNNYLLKTTGYSEEELIGKSALDIFVPDDEKQKAKGIIPDLLQQKKDLYYHEGKILSKDNKVLHVTSHILLAKDKRGKIKGVSILGENITEKNAIITKLKEAKEKAEESNRLKSVFLQNISHEIRTPMNAIIGFMSLLKDSPVDEETRIQFYDIINKSGERLLDTVNDLIDISQIETQQIKVNKTAINISELLATLQNTGTPLAAQNNNTVTCTSKYLRTKTILHTDKNLLTGILTNLLSNAMKFTSNGTIEIGSTDKGNDIVFFVKDTGTGIPENRLEAIFDRFVQADLSLSRAHEGAGLGLSIAKAYAQLLGGDLWVESEVGKGSTFFFNLPKTEVKPEEPETIIPETIEKNMKDNHKILVAEDDEMSYLLLKNLLKQRGFRIAYAKNGAEAVEMVRNDNEISLVLMDIKMPVMNGEEAIRQIRTFNQNVPIIAQTAYAMPTDRNKFLEIGSNDYISKPIETNKLIKLLGKYVNILI